MIHAFSVGGYMCGETYVKINGRPETYGQVGQRIQCQVLDSPVDLENIPYGFSKAVTPVPHYSIYDTGHVGGILVNIQETSDQTF